MPISPLADSNVRSGSRPGAGSRLGLRPSRLARLLLLSLSILRTPAGPIALSLVMLSTSACIIPLGPDFQDPVAGPNDPPFFESASPDFGSIVTPPATPPSVVFSVTLTDPNVGDDLYIEWQADYPGVNHRPLVGTPFVHHDINGKPLHQAVTATVDCIVDNLTPTPNGEHQIEVIVADRPFVEPAPGDTHLDLVEKPGFAIHASWFVEQLICPAAPNQ